MEIATYRYKHKTGVYPVMQYESFSMKVEILEELPSSRLRIKFLGYHADGRGPGSISTVMAKSVKRTGGTPEVQDKDARPLSDAVRKLNIFRGYDPDEIRKPYKDD